jgi:hypothetical protein
MLVAVQDERLAGGALPLLAAVHQHDPLLLRGPQDVLVSPTSISMPTGSNADDVLLGHNPFTYQDAHRTDRGHKAL